MSDHEQFEELAVGYALNALEPEDEDTFTRHLATCPPCGQLLAEMRCLAGHVAYATDPAPPPPELAEAITAAVRGADVRRPPAPVIVVEPAGIPGQPRRLGTSRRVLVAAAASVAILLGLSSWVTALRLDGANKSRRISAAEQVLVKIGNGARLVPLRPVSTAAAASGFVALDGQQVQLVLDGLPPNGSAETYVSWVSLDGGRPQALGAFDVTRRGVVVIDVGTVAPQLDATATFAVSREPGHAPPDAPTDTLLR